MDSGLPPSGQSLFGMTERDRLEWMQQTRLRQLVMDEARAWKSFAWAAGSSIGAFCLLALGIWIAGTFASSHVRSTRPEGMKAAGVILQLIAGLGFWVFGIRTLVRLARWMEAIWRRRRFSSR
jgi:hypothetical protein